MVRRGLSGFISTRHAGVRWVSAWSWHATLDWVSSCIGALVLTGLLEEAGSLLVVGFIRYLGAFASCGVLRRADVLAHGGVLSSQGCSLFRRGFLAVMARYMDTGFFYEVARSRVLGFCTSVAHWACWGSSYTLVRSARVVFYLILARSPHLGFYDTRALESSELPIEVAFEVPVDPII